MKALLSLLVALTLLSGCTSTPDPLSFISEDWVLEPQNSDQEIKKDDQFLKKAQATEMETAGLRRRPYLKP